MLARYARREQEFAVRAAVGGGPGRLLRQLLTESVVIAALGGIGGLVSTAYALDLLVALMPADVPRLARIGVNERVLGFTAGLVVMTALSFGCAPAVRILRQDVNGPLTRGRRAGDTPAQQRLRRTLVAAEVALALVLLVGAGPARAELRAAGQRRPRLRPAEHRGAAGVPLRRRRQRGHPQLLSRDPRRHSRAPRRRRSRRRIGVPARPRRPDGAEPPDPARSAAASTRRRAVDGRRHGDPGLFRDDADPAPGGAVVRRARRRRRPGRRGHQRDAGAAALAGRGSAHATGVRAGLGTGHRGGDRRRGRRGAPPGASTVPCAPSSSSRTRRPRTAR